MSKAIPYVTKYPMPRGMGAEAKNLWEWCLSNYNLRKDECRILVDICREIDVVNRIERDLESSPSMTRGSQGQEVANPLFAEARQHRQTTASLIKQLKLEGRAVAGSKSRGQVAASNVIDATAKWRSVGAS
jgi:hypothetical protein